MARPRTPHPTPGELEVLHLLWSGGEMTVRDVHEVLSRKRRRAYTSVMSLLNVMTEKGLLVRKPRGRAFVYAPRVNRSKTMGSLISDLLGRAFEGSASALVAHLLEESSPSREELERIHELIDEYERAQGGSPC